MDRRAFVSTAGLAAATSAIASPAIAQSQPTIRWRLQSSFPKSLDAIYGAGEVFAEAVAELTDGRFQIQVFAAGEIINPTRKHARNGMLSPVEFERQHKARPGGG